MVKSKYATKIKKLDGEFNSRTNSFGGISIDTLSEEQKNGLVLFANENWSTLVVKRGKKHELVYDDSGFVGIVISTNGETRFRQYEDFSVRYVRLTRPVVVDYKLVHGVHN